MPNKEKSKKKEKDKPFKMVKHCCEKCNELHWQKRQKKVTLDLKKRTKISIP